MVWFVAPFVEVLYNDRWADDEVVYVAIIRVVHRCEDCAAKAMDGALIYHSLLRLTGYGWSLDIPQTST